jgi:hypothetical protein
MLIFGITMLVVIRFMPQGVEGVIQKWLKMRKQDI